MTSSQVYPMKSRKDFLYYYPQDSPFEHRNQLVILRKHPRRRQPRKKTTTRPPPPDNKMDQSIITFLKTASSIAIFLLNALLTKRGILLLISVSLGLQAGRSTTSFCLAVLSLVGGSGRGQEHPFLILLVFLGGFYVGHNQVTVYVVLLSWLVAYACHLHVKDVVIMTLAYWFGILANVSSHIFFVVVFSYLGGKAIEYDKKIFFYLGLSFLVASMGHMNENLPMTM